jgi:hypothetical protein
MDVDFPAAHSMDTTWFAVDKDGHVGLFFTCEDGHLPLAAARTDAHDLLGRLWALRRKAGRASGGEPENHYDLGREDMASRLGLFYYRHRDDVPVGDDQILIGRYLRLVVPKEPLHVDQLPADLRGGCQTVHFEKAVFAGDQHLQPMDAYPCTMWNPEGAVAYLSADGTTVRPTPGHESQFEDFCARLREEFPEYAAKLRFEAPPKKPSKGKRKGPGRAK